MTTGHRDWIKDVLSGIEHVSLTESGICAQHKDKNIPKLKHQCLHQQGIAQQQAGSLHHHHRQCTIVQLQLENNASQEQVHLAFFSERAEMVLGNLSEEKETSRVF